MVFLGSSCRCGVSHSGVFGAGVCSAGAWVYPRSCVCPVFSFLNWCSSFLPGIRLRDTEEFVRISAHEEFGCWRLWDIRFLGGRLWWLRVEVSVCELPGLELQSCGGFLVANVK